MTNNQGQGNFWTTIPGILTGIAGILTPIGVIYGTYVNVTKPSPPASVEASSHPSLQADSCNGYSKSGTLLPNECLKVNESLLSNNGEYELSCQDDGNLVFQTTSDKVMRWESETSGKGKPEDCYMQNDGNLVVRDSGKNLIWSSNKRFKTAGNNGAYLKVGNDGHIYIYKHDGSVYIEFPNRYLK
ncbi:MAG: hypothetical protein HWQ35_15545 [Nostoc sp. NMS1]|uniref:hypothetical protein n=1 Tax=Nostoc sp. NMS1 TaxID=2815388 RepID=UPI0025F222E6|nr:hypothetical protein [Nostoc sp. NMS1]MBN3907915.1 hypothetical protein [Nostoc sp. NMS1]